MLLVAIGQAHALSGAKRIGQCRLDVWGAREGLPGYDITSLAQTPDGYIWVGTTAGLFRFDGQTFTRYDRTTVKGLSSSLIRSLLAASNGKLWVGTEWGGFGWLDGSKFHRVDSETQWNCTHSLHQAPDGSIFAGYISQTFKGILRYNGSLSKFPFTSGEFSTDFANLPSGGVATTVLYDRLKVVDHGKLTDYPLAAPLKNTDLRCMIRRADGSLWIGTDYGGVWEIKGRTAHEFTTVNGLSSNSVTCLFEDNTHRLLIGTNDGLDAWTSTGFEHIGPADGLGAYQVNAIMEDREGNLWVATGKTLNRFSDTALAPVNVVQGKQPKLNFAAPANDGGVYCATRDGLYYQPAQPWLPAHKLLSNGIEGAAQLSDGDIITWNYHPAQNVRFDIRRYRGGVWTMLGSVDFGPIGVLGDREPYTFLGNNGEIGTIGKGHINSLKSLGNPHIFCRDIDPSGVMWLGTEPGLIRVTGGTSTLVTGVTPAGAHVLSIDASDPRCLWLGTDKGLVRVVDGRGKTYGPADGLPDDDLLQIRLDGQGRVWVGGYFGIFSVRIGDIDAYDRHLMHNIPATLYTYADGVRAYPDLGMPVRGADGKLWFVGPDGLTCVDVGHLATNNEAPPVSIETADVDGVAVISGLKNALAPGRGAFTIHFAALSFNAPEKVRFRYRLVGYDSAWVDAGGQHSASYTNLPPGAYTFEVTACNNDGIWAASPATVHFTIRPHFYQTGWFRVLAVAAFVVLVLGIARVRMRQIELRSRDLQVKVAERTAELATATAEVTASAERLQERNAELQEIQAELEAQNQELQETQQTLAAANERLHALATTDGLTGLINHRAFQERLEAEWNRHRREGTPLSLILLDVDNFKSYNDVYGHPAGDEVLRSVAQILRSSGRESDVVGRYGGEEFVVIAPNTDAAGSVELAERLRAAVEGGNWRVRPVTGSFGTSTVQALDVATPAALIAQADEALYRSKHEGKNRVSSFTVERDVLRPAA